jgi:hypothetical protein
MKSIKRNRERASYTRRYNIQEDQEKMKLNIKKKKPNDKRFKNERQK